jgi:hypothetical protein
MELTVTQENQTALQRKEHATGLIATLSKSDSAREFERSLTVQKIVEKALPICEMIRVTSSKEVAQAIDIALTKLVRSVNIGNNLNDDQIKVIVEDLIDRYKTESIEDFILVFKKARQGEFGTIYNLHSAVIFEWVEKYLDTKYQVLEAKLRAEKNKPEPVLIRLPDGVKHFETVFAPLFGFKLAKRYAANLSLGSKVPRMTEKDIKRFGQKDPLQSTKTAGYKWFNIRGINVLASTEDHAKEMIKKAIESGELIEVDEESKRLGGTE